MNNYLLGHILINLLNLQENNYDKNRLINLAEEYIEWINLSLTRFVHDDIDKQYKFYLKLALEVIQRYQAFILLDEVKEAKEYLQVAIKHCHDNEEKQDSKDQT